jgi:hypothetical protein
MAKFSIRLYIGAGLAAAMVLVATPARAQYKPRPLNDPATGENFHIEAGAGWWFPSSDIAVASSGSGALSGIIGSQIDAKNDLGFTDSRLPEIQVVLRPARSHKFRFQYIPINYDANATLPVTIVFNGIRYPIGVQVHSTLDWKAYRFGYEYDFVTKNKGFVGFIVEAKYTDVRVELDAQANGAQLQEFAQARAPIPAIGGIGRYYVVPNISITGEVTAFKLPDVQNKYGGHYVDVDVYGTLNFTNNIGVQGGYRSMDLGYLVKQDTGSFTLRGVYFGVVARY